MAQASRPPHKGQTHLPAVPQALAECQLQLPPFDGCAKGWAGSLSQFLARVHEGTFLLECVPLAAVVDQYISHINGLDLDAAGELLELAASLIYWKSRLLLPCDPLLVDTDGGPRQEILRGLRAGQQRRDHDRTSPINEAETNHAPQNDSELSLLDLFVLLNEVEQMLFNDSTYHVSASPITVADQLQWLSRWFANHESIVNSADVLLLRHRSRPAKICLFLALLEMTKRGQLNLNQIGAFETISIQPVKAQTPRPSTDR